MKHDIDYEDEAPSLVLRRLASKDGSAMMSDYGAQVLSWAPRGESPVVWQPYTLHFIDGKPLQGGVPVAFPWFGSGFSHGKGAGKKPHHGFGRILPWTVDTRDLSKGDISYVLNSSDIPEEYLELVDSDGAPEFRVVYRVEGGSNLRMTLKVTNLGGGLITYEEALHTYLRVSDVANVELKGLEKAKYLDATLPDFPLESQGESPVLFTGPVDRIYSSREALVLRDEGLRRAIGISKKGSNRTVVWNPGYEAGNRIADLENGESDSFVCVEAVNCREDAIKLGPGQSHILSQTLSLWQI
ncbi:MAG: D-hexose-6-phosphate mutarotase [Bifidobacteriaceae bacterium]|jgi:glucose-6-phosphate 1-epimerase|nr:D-hexose-6-phosphate mutarotase [Bifidobacteriaceae bacterium]